MNIKKLIETLKHMPPDVSVNELTLTMGGSYYIVYTINWMELQKKKLKLDD